jgi:uncharacterized membrane protein
MGTSITQTKPSPLMQSLLTRPMSGRLESIDLLRGLVMIIMALDHVRDFMSDRLFLDATDLKTTTPAIFLTRWITHYCAPTFIFLAGTSAFLSGARGKSKNALAWFLLTRGLWLAFLEVTINRALWMFNYDFLHYGAGVFWAIGWSMVALAGLVYLPTFVVTLLGVLMIVEHNMLDGVAADTLHLPGWLWVILHSPGDATVVNGITFGTGYCLIPWIGVMAAGYGFGSLLLLERTVRRKLLLQLGAALILGFIVLRAINVYGDPRLWDKYPTPPGAVLDENRKMVPASSEEKPTLLGTALSFLNCTKYPASLLYLLMTLGPSIFALGLFDRPLGPLAQPIITFGRVPLFYYLLHIPLIHGAAILCDYLRFGWSPQAFAGPWEVQPGNIPESYGLSLPLVYAVWVGVILILYWPCRWFAGVKARHPGGWLSYF